MKQMLASQTNGRSEGDDMTPLRFPCPMARSCHRLASNTDDNHSEVALSICSPDTKTHTFRYCRWKQHIHLKQVFRRMRVMYEVYVCDIMVVGNAVCKIYNMYRCACYTQLTSIKMLFGKWIHIIWFANKEQKLNSQNLKSGMIS